MTFKKAAILAGALIFLSCGVALAEREAAAAKFNNEAVGEAIVKISLSAPGYRWSAGPWSPPLEIRLDGKKVSSLVPFRGDEQADYDFIFGPVEPGRHTVSLVDPAKTTRELNVAPISIKMLAPVDSSYDSLSHSPILLGRPENENSDVPLIFWYAEKSLPDGKLIDYTVVWSNEDGGTPTAQLLAKYGRTVDIESIYTMKLDKSGAVVSEIIQGADHVVRSFAGRKIGNHPVLRTCTTNNMVDDTGDSPFIFTYLPLQFDTEGTRERMMDRLPWINRIAYEELEKEKKLSRIVPDFGMGRVDDLRRYALVDLDTESFGSAIEVALKIRGKDKWYAADQGIAPMRLNRPGKARVGIWLPDGVGPADIESLRLTAAGKPGDRVTFLSAGPVTFLDKEFRPIQMTFPWKKKQAAPVGGKPIVITF
ncbi:MAG: hypothetical protein WCX65_03965 [bacterium]